MVTSNFVWFIWYWLKWLHACCPELVSSTHYSMIDSKHQTLYRWEGSLLSLVSCCLTLSYMWFSLWPKYSSVMIAFTCSLLNFVPQFANFLIGTNVYILVDGTTFGDYARWLTKLSSDVDADFWMTRVKMGVTIGCGGSGIVETIVRGFVAALWRSLSVALMTSERIEFFC